ncbi:MAG: DUF4922 domain-containing protein [Muribaculaceae bacterium]|nr:DUF4922 domain-containing protein [Muribaculaceae bacterium]
MTHLAQEVDALFERQLRDWPMVRNNFAALEQVQLRHIALEHAAVVLQCNSVRRRSSAARTDAASLAARPCFLCSHNQPKEQEMVRWGDYKIQVNPYPIFPRHLTISALEHTPQQLWPLARIDHMLQLAAELPHWVVFFNGARCGASAPDHMHFQAGCKGFLPLCDEITEPDLWPAEAQMEVCDEGFIGYTHRLGRPVFLIRAAGLPLASLYFSRLLLAMRMSQPDSQLEPMVNVLAWRDGDYLNVAVFPRRKHRPACFGPGADQLLISPASVDMGGVWAVPEPANFERLNATLVQQIYDELCVDDTGIARIMDNFIKTSN